MNLERAIKLQKQMPWKNIFHDLIHHCYRLISPSQLHEYQDEEGRRHKRPDIELDNLCPI